MSPATDPADLGALEAARELRARRVSARELLAAVLARIEARNGGAPTFDGAPDAVNAGRGRAARGLARGPRRGSARGPACTRGRPRRWRAPPTSASRARARTRRS